MLVSLPFATAPTGPHFLPVHLAGTIPGVSLLHPQHMSQLPARHEDLQGVEDPRGPVGMTATRKRGPDNNNTYTWSGPRGVVGYTEAHACAWPVCQLSLSDP
jgi:hypothetical protein